MEELRDEIKMPPTKETAILGDAGLLFIIKTSGLGLRVCLRG